MSKTAQHLQNTPHMAISRGISSDAVPAILVVEDQDVSRRALSTLLRLNGYQTAAVGSAEEALSMFGQKKCPPIALVDFDLPGMSGLDLINRLREFTTVFTVLLTAADSERVKAALCGQPDVYMQKPVNFEHLLALLSSQGTQSLAI